MLGRVYHHDPGLNHEIMEEPLSTSTNHKVWAAKFTARHPNLVTDEVTSLKRAMALLFTE